MAEHNSAQFRIMSANGDVVLVSIDEIVGAGDRVFDDVEDAIRNQFDDSGGVVIESRSRR